MTLLLLGSVTLSGQAWGHANFMPKDTLDNYTGRAYQEGSSAYLKIALGHGCRNADRTETYATRHVSVVFPNTEDLTGVAFTADGDGVEFGANALMGIKPKINRAFKKIKIFKGDVPEYYNHGAKARDARAVHWDRGWVPDDMYETLELRASLPKLKGCVKKLRVYVPVVQHCEGGHTLAWLREPTAVFGEDVISPGYAPYIDVVRDEEMNPSPEGCAEADMEAEVYPSATDIDTYLPHGSHGDSTDDNDNAHGGHNHGGMDDNDDMSMGGDNDDMSMGGDNDDMSMGGDNDDSGMGGDGNMPVDGGDGTGAGAGPIPTDNDDANTNGDNDNVTTTP